MKTLVYLIGTGPGAPGLITVRGQRCLDLADVVIYDRSVPARVLDLAPRRAERIDVGRPARETTDQDAISFLVAEKAREGKVVARLKHGDQFLFDRGGEEALFMHEQGIPFEVVPGVPVVLGVAAYAGIPLTYPGGGDTLTIVRGHEAGNGARTRINWTLLAKLDGTLACFGGREELAEVLKALTDHGRPADDRAALVVQGTLAAQATIAGTIGDIAARLAEGPIDGPGTLIVGKVVGLREHVRWFDQRPLFGRRVLVTRSRHQATELVELLEAAGAEAVEAPVLRVVPLDDFAALDAAADAVGDYDWVVFTTVNGVDGFMHRLFERGRDARALAGPPLCAVGVGTSERLTRFGIRADVVAEGQDVDSILTAMGGRAAVEGKRVLMPNTSGSRDTLGEALTAARAEVRFVPSFRTLAAEDNPDLDVYGQLLERRIDVVTFASAAAVHSFAALYGEEQTTDLLVNTIVATVGPAATEAVRRLGVSPAIVAATPSIPALVDAIRAHFQ
ncbi:MAG TPA: uroporphyrinogen-III C-methyltransferase [Vicinamibacterales bacterium]|nr:uroporphyrinogen-III C-methyltransferase [Vicinamibacterales bacterium]